jgi:hypothetical protein
LGIKHEDRRMILLARVTFVDHIQIARLVEGDVVRGLPGVFVWQLRPVVQHLVLVRAAADDERPIGLLCSKHSGQCQRGSTPGGGCLDETTP